MRDIAVVYQSLLAERGLSRVTCVGLGFGGWIAAEMATMAPAQLRRLVLVGAMGIKPERGEILDQALVSYIEYVRAGFHEPAALDRAYGTELPTPLLERWDVNRETTFRIAWRPYMFNPSLPHLLGGVRTPTLILWGAEDRVVPLECGERYAKAMPAAKLAVIEKAGHLVDMERPAERRAGHHRLRGILGAGHAPHVLHRAADVGVPRGRGPEVRGHRPHVLQPPLRSRGGQPPLRRSTWSTTSSRRRWASTASC